jgi:hypothetical protein
MILSELHGGFEGQTLEQVVKALVTKNKLGSADGSNAIVLYAPSKSYVYRVWVDDAGYEEWLKYAVQNQSNPHVLKVLSKVRTVQPKLAGIPDGKTVKFVKLEKLGDLTMELANTITTAFQAAGELGEAELREMEYDGFVETMKETAEMYTDDGEGDHIVKTMKKYDSFFKFYYELSVEKGYRDMHAENCMMRGSVPVIIDPLHLDENIISASDMVGALDLGGRGPR